MKKYDFLKKLEELLGELPRCDIDSSVEYYSEMIDDKIDEGLSEEEAVCAIGTPEKVAEGILAESPVQKSAPERIKTKRKISGGEITLLILGFPLWFPLLIAALAVVFAIVISLWSVVVSLWATFAALIVSSVACLIVSIIGILTGQFVHGLALLASALIVGGISLFVFIGCKAVNRVMWWLTKVICIGIKRIFVGRGKK
jgi:uncharacterized membrane protein